MLTRLLFTFATLSLFAVSAIAQDIPAKRPAGWTTGSASKIAGAF
jgi:hypothetical protein